MRFTLFIVIALFAGACTNSPVETRESVSTTTARIVDPIAVRERTLVEDSLYFRFTATRSDGDVLVSEGAVSTSGQCGWSELSRSGETIYFRIVANKAYVGLAQPIDGYRWLSLNPVRISEFLGTPLEGLGIPDLEVLVPVLADFNQTGEPNTYSALIDGVKSELRLDESGRVIWFARPIGEGIVEVELSKFGEPVVCEVPPERETLDYAEWLAATENTMPLPP